MKKGKSRHKSKKSRQSEIGSEGETSLGGIKIDVGNIKRIT